MAVGPSDATVRGMTLVRMAGGAEKEEKANGCRVGQFQLFEILPFPPK